MSVDIPEELIVWPSFRIEDTLPTTNASPRTPLGDDDSWGEPQELLSWEAPKFTLIERQRATRFWNPNAETEKRNDRAAKSVKDDDRAVVTVKDHDHAAVSVQDNDRAAGPVKEPTRPMHPWRRRREDLSRGISDSRAEVDLAPDDQEEVPRPAKTEDIHTLYVPIAQRPPLKDPNEHFARVLEPEEFMKLTECGRFRHAITPAPDTDCSITPIDMSTLNHAAQHEPPARKIVSQKSGRSKMIEKWTAPEVHLLDGIAANFDFAPLKPTVLGVVLHEVEPEVLDESSAQQNVVGTEDDTIQMDVMRQMQGKSVEVDLMDQDVEHIPYRSLTPESSLLFM